jgi:hypothetical protein
MMCAFDVYGVYDVLIIYSIYIYDETQGAVQMVVLMWSILTPPASS